MNNIPTTVPFCVTRQYFAYLKDQWQTSRTWQEITKTIAKIALTIFASPLLIAVDLLAFVARAIDRIYAYREATAPLWTLNSEGKKVPTPNLIDRVLTFYSAEVPLNSNDRFLRHSMQTAFKSNTFEIEGLYRQLIYNDGVLEAGGGAPINIHQWSAGCLLVNYLKAKQERMEAFEQFYPAKHPDQAVQHLGNGPEGAPPPAREHEQDVTRIARGYQAITFEEQAAVALQIQVPSEQWQLSLSAQHLVNKIKARALAMTQDPAFLEIYQRAIRTI